MDSGKRTFADALNAPAASTNNPANDPVVFQRVQLMIHTTYGLILVLQWDSKTHTFKIHGLWPRCAYDRRYELGSPSELKFNPWKDLSTALRDNLRHCWPNLEKRGDHENFWFTQWWNHGRFSGLEPLTYFSTALDLYNELKDRNERLGSAGVTFGFESDKSYPKHEVVRRIHYLTGVVPQITLENVEHERAKIKEVRIYMDHSGGFVDYGAASSLDLEKIYFP